MTSEQTLLLFAGPVLALLGGLMIYLAGPLLDRWEAWRLARHPKG